MSKLIASQNNEEIVLIDGTRIEIETGMFNDPLGFVVTEETQYNDYAALVQAARDYVEAVNTPKSDSLHERAKKFAALAALLSSEPTPEP